MVVKPWPNGVASRRKLKTWVYLRLRLARALVTTGVNLNIQVIDKFCTVAVT